MSLPARAGPNYMWDELGISKQFFVPAPMSSVPEAIDNITALVTVVFYKYAVILTAYTM